MSAPNGLMFLISLILGGLAVASRFMPIQFVSTHQFWFLAGAWGLLVFACLFRVSRA